MDPSGSAFMVTFQLIALAIELEQVPDDIRRCLELVQTCHRDTQHLIEMRNDNLAELEKRPKELAHVDSIIVSASNSLREVAELVEKCRPDVNQGRTHLGKRLWWRYVDRELFQMQRPIVERHHTAVVSELNYVRQLGLLALGSKPMNGSVGAQREKLKMRRASEYENMGMLDSMFGSGTLNTGLSLSKGQGIATLPTVNPNQGRSASWPSDTEVFGTVLGQGPGMPMSPLPDAAPPPYSSIKETTPNIASAPYVMHARIPDEPVKSIYSDPKASKRKDLGEKIMRQPTQAREDRAFEDQGLAALLGASGVIPAVVETTIVHQETNMNGPINITVNVNNYSGTSNSVTIPRDQGDLREADMRTAMNAAHTALQNLSLHHNTTTQSPVENCCPVNPYEAPAWSGLPPERPPKVVMSESGVHEFGSWTQQTEGRGANPEDPQLPGNSNVRVDYMSNDSAKQMRNSVQIPQSVQWGSCSQEGSTSEARRVGADPVIQNTFYALPSTPFPGPEQCGYFDMPMGPEIPTPPPTQDFYRAPGNTLLAHPQSTVRGPSTAPSCDPYSPPATHHNLPYPAASYHLSAQGAAIARPSSTQIQATPSPISAGAHAPHIGEARYFVPSPQYVDSSLPNRPNSLAPSPMSTGAGAELFSPQGLCAVGASPGVQSRGGRELGTASMAPSFPASNYHNHQIYPAELE